MRSAALRGAMFLVLALTLTISLAAQIQNGQFTGTVTDPSGAAVPNASVRVSNVATDLTVTVKTNTSGGYIARELPPGQYRITVEAPGFKSLTRSGLTLNAGTIQRVDLPLTVGETTEVVEVVGEAPLVNTVDSKPQTTISSRQIENLPLNGRNVFDLITQAPGAVSVAGVMFENGADAVVNGVRENFNGFLMNGVSNKGLSGGANTQPILDTVQEFQVVTLNMSAQYGNSAGSITNLVTKGGTNEFHGSGWWFNRNDVFDATPFAIRQGREQAEADLGRPCEPADLCPEKPPLRFNQFGGTLGGPIIKDKLFFFGSGQISRFLTSTNPAPVLVESPQWSQAVQAAFPNSIAGLLYGDFPPLSGYGTPVATVNDNVLGFWGDYATMFCTASVMPGVAENIATLIGISADEIAAMSATPGCAVPFGAPVAGVFSRDDFQTFQTVNIARNRNGTRANGNLYHGNEWSARLDYNLSDSNRLFGQFNWFKNTDEFFVGPAGFRGFNDPLTFESPNFQFNWVTTFSPQTLNEFKAGYASNRLPIIPETPGVPAIGFDDGTGAFGSYNGYPQIFREHIYSFSDMVSLNRGNHNIKIGADVRRNMENSEFNVGRPSYYFFDQLFFAADAPYFQAAGVDPGLAAGVPSHLSSNIRHFRNWEYGFYVQDDWKVTRNFTLNLGLRYDLYLRHQEINDLETTFLLGPGNSIIDDISTGAGQLQSANIPAGLPGCDTPTQMATAQLAGVCGPGGFAPADKLGENDKNNWGPRVGFAWDMFGTGKTSLRGGAGISYEGTFYNAMSNSRWNLPYYSFNLAINALGGGADTVVYGPQSGGTPSYTGDADPNNNQGTGSTAVGNIMGWAPTNPNTAILTGIVFPQGVRDPYVMNWFLGFQQELWPRSVLEVNYVGTAGRKLFRAENINRIPGGRLPAGTCATDDAGRTVCSQVTATNPVGRLNPNYGTLRVWQNSVNSSYNGLQVSLKQNMNRGVSFAAHYTWSHSLDGGSTWHSGATTANGAAAGEGFTLDHTRPELDYGNSIYDIRHRFAANFVWELPFFKGQGGALEHILGGWQWNGATAIQSGAHWSPFDSRSAPAGGDYNRDGVNNDRPNAQSSSPDASFLDWANGWGSEFNGLGGFWTAPCAGCASNLGRNTLVGPGFWTIDTSLFKNIKITERVNLQFRTEVFNLFNRTNFQLPGVSGFNRINSGAFGLYGGTFNPRNMQFGLRLTF